ncbi:DUF1722 domain-containing protein [Hydrocarboniclastica marina]|uniref:DUF1722 domain-containing protein n=1 Tax=Hydrocarboniclastica marina TaxID=2259620 RepID=A0A4P7XLQ1_9ALTE|nr:DUF1722 domain-containing protein [Hydrocarboniclastica marina]MAL97203.1 hypothetical protein [Alteromonadaceae bacterium]QCF27352.1 DUF1722 domain-containing protein [Hydrocarboniclastica marina]
MASNPVYDVDPGFLDDHRLAAQMRLLVGLVTSRSRPHPEHYPTVWVGYEDALSLRLNQTIGELRLRGLATPEPVALTDESILWPALDRDRLRQQLQDVAAGPPGRIRLPRNDHELWATYKYAVLARNQNSYSRIGQRVAARSFPLEQLWPSLINATHVPPQEEGLRNALQHMWGYVSRHSTVNPQGGSLPDLLREVQQLAVAHEVSYLLNSTALGEFAAWLER